VLAADATERARVIARRVVLGLLLVVAAIQGWGIALWLEAGSMDFDAGTRSRLVVTITFVAGALPSGKIVERYGSRWMIFLSESLGIPVMLGWIYARTPLAFALVSVVNGIVAATWVPALQTLIANSVEDRVRAQVIGQITAIRSLFAFPAPFLGGILYETFGYEAPMVASLVGIVGTLVLVLRFIHDPPKE